MTIPGERIAISIKEAAAMIGCSTTYLYDLAKAGDLPGAYRMGSRWFVAIEPSAERLARRATNRHYEPMRGIRATKDQVPQP